MLAAQTAHPAYTTSPPGFAKTEYDRANAINNRAERIQAKSDALMDRTSKVFKLVVPNLVFLVAAAGLLLFRIM